LRYLHDSAPADERDKIQNIENMADECYKLLRLLHRPRNQATWALLTRMALELENRQQQYGANKTLHRIALVVLDRCVTGFKFIAEHSKPASRLLQSYTWNGSLVADAEHALLISKHYLDFVNVFPMWHKNHEEAELLADDRVRFHLPNDTARQRQVIAYQQGERPRGTHADTPYMKRKETPAHITKILNAFYQTARPRGGSGKFTYKPTPELIEALRPEYQERLDSNFRHPDSFLLNGYTLKEFKSFYIALLILCAIHEYICYPWNQPGQPVPVSSLVMVKTRNAWLAELQQISGLSAALCQRIIADLTLNPLNKNASLCINPFVPLDQFSLAVAPQFPLGSAVDENILRTFSYLYPALFSAQNTEKDPAMKAAVRAANPGYHIEDSIELPDKSTEIDILLEDDASSSVVLAELKWIRKPNRVLERIDREADVAKGIRQLDLVRDYTRKHPDFLMQRGKLTKPLTAYTHVHYLLLVRDFWYWHQPQDAIALLDFDAVLVAFKESTTLFQLVERMLTYDWLPVEGRDFTVMYSPSSVHGVTLESPLFKSTRP